MSATDVLLLLTGLLLFAALLAWVYDASLQTKIRRTNLARRLQENTIAMYPSPVVVTVVWRPSERAYLVLVDNPTRTGQSAAGRTLPTLPWRDRSYRRLEPAQQEAHRLRYRYALLECPDEVIPS